MLYDDILNTVNQQQLLYYYQIIAFKSEIGQGNARQREKNLGERGMFV